MICPTEIGDILLEIISVAALNIRRAGNSGDAARCAAEADHIHNLPVLISEYRPELLDFYWHTERVAFLEQVEYKNTSQFEPLWSRIEAFMVRQEGRPGILL